MDKTLFLLKFTHRTLEEFFETFPEDATTEDIDDLLNGLKKLIKITTPAQAANFMEEEFGMDDHEVCSTLRSIYEEVLNES